MRTIKYLSSVSGVASDFPDKITYLDTPMTFEGFLSMNYSLIEGKVDLRDSVRTIVSKKDGLEREIRTITATVTVSPSLNLGRVNDVNNTIKRMCNQHNLKFQATIDINEPGVSDVVTYT